MYDTLIILDADGVFLNERPYWEAALRIALVSADLAVPSAVEWHNCCDVAFGEAGLHRVTKRRGCNSNWDLAAVLCEVLGDTELRATVAQHLAERCWATAAACLIDASAALWTAGAKTAAESDPLLGFGIRRTSEAFSDVQRTFQRELQCVSATDPGALLCRNQARIQQTFRTLRAAGCVLAVCTGRTLAELQSPLLLTELLSYFDPQRIVTAETCAAAECSSGATALGKPHWFPAACAVLGLQQALLGLEQGRVTCGGYDRVVYVGDGIADFACAQAARRVGLAIDYIHCRSGVTTVQEEDGIASAPQTVAVIDRVTQLPACLSGRADGALENPRGAVS